VTGVCDKPDLVKRFNEIASTIKKNAGMEGVLVNIQALPYAVNCLLYPLNNTEDFEDGIFMDNTGAQGHDLAKDPDRVVLAEKTLASENVVIAGPLPLRQCQECHPTVEKAFIARLPITMEGHDIEVNGNVYKKKWGFSVVLINWKELVERSGIYETFDSKGSQFRLTRTDKKYDTDKEEYSQEVRANCGWNTTMKKQDFFSHLH
jgi:sensor domain CHASE-containing protein